MFTKLFNNGIWILFISLFVIACNSESKQTESAAKSTEEMVSVDTTINADVIVKGCENIGPMVIKQTAAEDLMKHFDTVFRFFGTATPKLNLRDSFWVDDEYIAVMANFFNSNPKFDGIRIYFGVDPVVPYNVNIITTPTIFRNDGPNNTGHVDQFGENIALGTLRPHFNNFVHNAVNYQVLHPMCDRFELDHRQRQSIPSSAKKDSLSTAVWFDKCAILVLNEFIKNPRNRLNGVSIYSAAYRDSITYNTNHTQVHPIQSTLILVPTSGNSDSIDHTDNWGIIRNTLKRSSLFKTKDVTNGFNHGELCPHSCR